MSLRKHLALIDLENKYKAGCRDMPKQHQTLTDNWGSAAILCLIEQRTVNGRNCQQGKSESALVLARGFEAVS